LPQNPLEGRPSVGARLRLHPECSHSSDGAPTEGRPYKVLTQRLLSADKVKILLRQSLKSYD